MKHIKLELFLKFVSQECLRSSHTAVWAIFRVWVLHWYRGCKIINLRNISPKMSASCPGCECQGADRFSNIIFLGAYMHQHQRLGILPCIHQSIADKGLIWKNQTGQPQLCSSEQMWYQNHKGETLNASTVTEFHVHLDLATRKSYLGYLSVSERLQ